MLTFTFLLQFFVMTYLILEVMPCLPMKQKKKIFISVIVQAMSLSILLAKIYLG